MPRVVDLLAAGLSSELPAVRALVQLLFDEHYPKLSAFRCYCILLGYQLTNLEHLSPGQVGTVGTVVRQATQVRRRDLLLCLLQRLAVAETWPDAEEARADVMADVVSVGGQDVMADVVSVGGW